MVKIAWKEINGYGPYAYLQETITTAKGTVVSKHIAYLGKIGKLAVPGKHMTAPGDAGDAAGKRILVPAVPSELKDMLKPNALKLVEELEAGKPAELGAISKKAAGVKIQASTKVPAPATIKVKAKAPAAAAPPASVAKPKITQKFLTLEGKPILKSFDVDRLEAAAAQSIEQLEATGDALTVLTSNGDKKKAVAGAVKHLSDQVKTINDDKTKAAALAATKDLLKDAPTPPAIIPSESKPIVIADAGVVSKAMAAGVPTATINLLQAAANEGGFSALRTLTTTIVAGGDDQAVENGILAVHQDLADKLLVVADKAPQLAPKEEAEKPAGKVKPKISFIPKGPTGKALISSLNRKKLEDAAAQSVFQLEAAGKEISDKLLAQAKIAATMNAVADLREQITGKQKVESESASEEAMTVEAVASGEQKLPAQATPKSEALDKIGKAATDGKTKNWDAALENVSGKKGSNEGGLFKDKTTQTFHYVKWPTEELRARAEALAANLYTAAGTPVPTVDIIKFGGNTAVKSDWIDDVQPMTVAAMSKHKDVRSNFAADAWLANWDVVGTSSDNIVKGPGNVAYRIDVGGSLFYRAQGKPKNFAPNAPELETLRSPATAPQAGKVFGNLKVAEIKASAKKLAGVTDQMIDEAVDRFIPTSFNVPAGAGTGADAGKPANAFLKDVLKARRDHIVTNVAKLKAPKTVSLAELKSSVDLPEKALKKILDKADELTPGSGSTAKRQVLENAGKLTSEDPDMSNEDLEKLRTFFGSWKGSSTGTTANILRFAGAEHIGKGKKLEAALKRSFKFFAKKQNNPALEQKFLAEFEAKKAADSPALVRAVETSNKVNQAVARIQFTPSGKLQAGAKVVVWRAWKPDQVSLFKWSNRAIGDVINWNDPTYFSWSFDKQRAKAFLGHGGILTKSEVPIRRLDVSDRVNGINTSHGGEDEILWVMPAGAKLEVVEKP